MLETEQKKILVRPEIRFNIGTILTGVGYKYSLGKIKCILYTKNYHIGTNFSSSNIYNGFNMNVDAEVVYKQLLLHNIDTCAMFKYIVIFLLTYMSSYNKIDDKSYLEYITLMAPLPIEAWR